MREHKFRAYNTLNNKMYDRILVYKDFLAQYDTTPTGQHTVTILSKQGDSASPFVPLEYAGFKDANDVEVYEDDIVEYSEYLSPLVYNKTLVIKWRKSGFWLWDHALDDWFDSMCSDERIRVIGNIYETPELLEGE